MSPISTPFPLPSAALASRTSSPALVFLSDRACRVVGYGMLRKVGSFWVTPPLAVWALAPVPWPVVPPAHPRPFPAVLPWFFGREERTPHGTPLDWLMAESRQSAFPLPRSWAGPWLLLPRS